MKLFWIESLSARRLAIVPRPRGGDWLDDEMLAIRSEGIDVLVSMLTGEEAEELGLAGEDRAAAVAGIEYLSFPIPDRQTPESSREFLRLVLGLRAKLRSGKSIGAHCRAGIGRSSLLVASLLCGEGHSAQDGFRLISAARGLQVPDTAEQMAWIESFASSLSG